MYTKNLKKTNDAATTTRRYDTRARTAVVVVVVNGHRPPSHHYFCSTEVPTTRRRRRCRNRLCAWRRRRWRQAGRFMFTVFKKIIRYVLDAPHRCACVCARIIVPMRRPAMSVYPVVLNPPDHRCAWCRVIAGGTARRSPASIIVYNNIHC